LMRGYIHHGRFLVVSLINTVVPPEGLFRLHMEMNRRLLYRYGSRFVNVAPVLRGGLSYCDETWMGDGAHPNESGCGVIADAIFKGMARNGFLAGTHFNDVPYASAREEEQWHQVPYVIAVTADTASVLLLQAGLRRSFTIWNNSTATLYVVYGYIATAGQSIAAIAPGGRQSFEGYSGPVSGIWTAINGDARVTEVI
jgi:hypothetical protein